MSERTKKIIPIAVLLVILLLFFSKILFTDKLISAPDIINEFYWSVKDAQKTIIKDTFCFELKADWDIYSNSGNTTEGGWIGGHFLPLHSLIFGIFPPPASVAWFIVIYLFFGAAGMYCYCRAIGASRLAALLGGLIFALASENASLINAGHVYKISTICTAPWAFFFLERGFISRRLIYFLLTALFLAFQFFEGHWQISFYTCLAVGGYALVRLLLLIFRGGEERTGLVKLIGMNVVLLIFFLSTVAISLLPLANWSIETNRGAQSGANQGKGGLQIEEAMSWSLPPEELVTFAIPGFFGFSRQEAGANPTNIDAYYWGRMVFTQTTDYMGLLPWLLVPLPLIFRRDKYTLLATLGIVGGLLFSFGKYTVFYQFLFDHFPGINRFRVPKMMMFVPVMALGVMAARGIDLLLDEEVRRSKGFRYYVGGLVAVPLLILALLGIELAFKNRLLETFSFIEQPTRYQQGPQLIAQRWNNLVKETGLAAIVAAGHVAAFFLLKMRRIKAAAVCALLILLYIVDVGRVNAKFMLLVNVPEKSKGTKTSVMAFLEKEKDWKEYRTLPMQADPMQFASANIPVLFTPHPVQQVRWQEFLDYLSLDSAMVDMVNLKYLVLSADQYAQEKQRYDGKYVPVFVSPDGGDVVLQNRTVLPKAWLVPAVYQLQAPRQALSIMLEKSFDPRRFALVERPAPLRLPGEAAGQVGEVSISRYEGEKIFLTANVTANALLVLGEKYYKGWKATVDGKPAEIERVNYILRGIYLPPGKHDVRFYFEPLSFKVGKWLTLSSFAIMALALFFAWRRKKATSPTPSSGA